MFKETDKCEICGKNLIYATKLNDYKNLKCEFCNKLFKTNIYCEDNHYICDTCHSKGPLEVIEEICKTTEIKDPFKLADKIMKHPKFKIYGPEHHILTPVVILTILKNNNIVKPNGKEITLLDIEEAIRRSSKISGGWCGFYGSCGAAMGSGVAISIFTNATPSTDIPRSLANAVTSRSLTKVADNLEHCCKRSLKLSLIETLKFLEEKFGITLNYLPNNCPFSRINPKCIKQKCPIF